MRILLFSFVMILNVHGALQVLNPQIFTSHVAASIVRFQQVLDNTVGQNHLNTAFTWECLKHASTEGLKNHWGKISDVSLETFLHYTDKKAHLGEALMILIRSNLTMYHKNAQNLLDRFNSLLARSRINDVDEWKDALLDLEKFKYDLCPDLLGIVLI